MAPKHEVMNSAMRELLAAMGIASGYLAVLVLALYINSDTAQVLYGRYELIWFLCPLLLYWISHIWLIAHRGRMPDDPVVFAMSDRTSRILGLLMLAIDGPGAMTEAFADPRESSHASIPVLFALGSLFALAAAGPAQEAAGRIR